MTHNTASERPRSFPDMSRLTTHLNADARGAGMALEELVLRLQHEVGPLPLCVRLVAVRPRQRRQRRCTTMNSHI